MNEIIKAVGSETLVALTTVVINVIIAAFGIYVYPVVKKILVEKSKEIEIRIGKENFDKLQMMAHQAVTFVEAEFKKRGIAEAGEAKKRQVIKYLNEQGFTDIDDNTVDMIIENAVSQMNTYKDKESFFK